MDKTEQVNIIPTKETVEADAIRLAEKEKELNEKLAELTNRLEVAHNENDTLQKALQESQSRLIVAKTEGWEAKRKYLEHMPSL